MRTWDAVKIADAIKCFLKNDELDVIDWLSNQENIVLENDLGDLAIFEYGFPTKKIYAAHYYFKSRGRQAITAGISFLDELFNSCYNVDILMGMVPVERKDVAWMTRRLGLTSYGIEEIHGQEYELFIMTKKEFNNE